MRVLGTASSLGPHTTSLTAGCHPSITVTSPGSRDHLILLLREHGEVALSDVRRAESAHPPSHKPRVNQ